MRKCTSEEFIKFCEAKYPGLVNRPDYRRMFMYLCFGTFLHVKTNKLAISYMTLAKFAGEKEAAKNKNFKAIEFLRNFKADVLPEFTWIEADEFDDGYGECHFDGTKYCRSVDNDGLDAETKAMAAKEVGNTGKKYYFDNGKLFSRANAAAEKKGVLAQYEKDMKSFNLNKTQQSIFDGLKEVSLNGRAYTQKLNDNLDKIETAIEKLVSNADDKISLEDKKIQQRKIIDCIREDPRVFYAPSALGRTCRLSATGVSAISFQSSIRKAFSSGWTEADLVSSQFVILAAILNAPISKAFIASKTHLWSYLHNFATGEEGKPSSYYKGIYKEVIYGICFGMGDDTIENRLKSTGLDKLLKCPIIEELLTLRRKWFKKINENKYVTDVWNNKHELKDAGTVKDIYGNLVHDRARWAGSLAATKIQSIEMEIVEAAFSAQKSLGEKYNWQITMFQHDGFTISFGTKERKEFIQEQIKKAIKDRAKKIGEKLDLDLSGVDIEFNDL